MHALLVRQLDVDGYGNFVLFQSTILSLAIITNGGWMHGVVMLATRYSLRKRWAHYKGVIIQTYGTTIGFSILASIPIWFIATSIFQNENQVSSFRWALVFLPVYALIFSQKGIFRSLNRADLSILPDETFLPLMMVLLLFFVPVATTNQAMIYFGLLIVLIALVVFLFQLRLHPVETRQITPSFMFKPWMFYTLPMVAGEIGNIVISRTDILMISALSSSEQAGYYSMAIRLSSLIMLAHTVIWPIYSARFSQAYVKRDGAESKRLLKISTLMAGGFALIPAIILVAYPQVAMLIFGEAGENAIWPMRILALAYLAHAATGPLGLFITMHGMHRQYSYIAIAAALVNISLNLLLIPKYGAIGGALTTLVTFVVWKAILLFWLAKVWHRYATEGK